jgi:predicted MFS family arabinose efflux permease
VESYGWQSPFYVFGGLGAASAVALLTWKRYEPRHGAMESELQVLFASGKAYDYRIAPRDVLQIVKPISNLWILLASVLNMIPTGAVGFWFIAMLRHDHGFDAAAATALMLTLNFVQVPGAVMIGRIADNWAVRRIDGRLRLLLHLTLWTLPCYAAGFLIPWGSASLSSPAFLAFLACVFAGAFFACALQPLCFNAVGDVNPPERRSLMFAVINITRLLGRAIGIQLVAFAAANWHEGHVGPGMATVSLMLLPAALCVLPVIRACAHDRASLSGHLQDYVAAQQLRDAA